MSTAPHHRTGPIHHMGMMGPAGCGFWAKLAGEQPLIFHHQYPHAHRRSCS